MKTDFKVALVAAASNEAAYVVDWVFHHLRFGFAPILIYVNRSTDGTEALLREMAKSVPQLQVENVDDVDQLPTPQGPQRTAYFRARKLLKKQQSHADYTTFADIDEFWTPADFTSSIQEVLVAAGKPKSAAFNWFQLVSDTTPFARPYEAEMRGIHHQLVKTTFRSKINVLRFNVHGVQPLLRWPIWSASGGKIALSAWHMTNGAPSVHGAAFILHRLYRSPLEYLAILGRGRSNFRDHLFKNNRMGYHDLVHRRREVVDFSVAQDLLDRYEADRLSFRATLNMEPALDAAKQTVQTRARHVLETYQGLDATEQEKWKTQFRWLDLDDLAQQLDFN